MNITRTCDFPGCDRPAYARGICSSHWSQERRGKPLQALPPMGATRADRFWFKVDKSGDCWLWTGATNPNGYGAVRYNKIQSLAHRIAWELSRGPIPPGMVIDHQCYNVLCVNPEHLRVVTQKQNAENHGRLRGDNSSGIRGVSWHAASNGWRADIRHNYKRIALGTFSTLTEAEAAVIAARNELFTHNDIDRLTMP